MREFEKRARDFAVEAHGSQLYGVDPYVSHLDEVVEILRPLVEGRPDEEILLVAAYLHDVLEDTSVSYEVLEKAFGADVLQVVHLCSDPVRPTRRERKEAAHGRIRALLDKGNVHAFRAAFVKAADRLANVRRCTKNGPSLLDMYRREHKSFTSAYYTLGASPIWDELSFLLPKETPR